MFDFIRTFTRSAAEKRRDQLNAYVDGALSPAAQRRFEAMLAEDETLRRDLAQLRAVKQALAGLPRMRAPRNFTLNPAVYARPAPPVALRLYPALRAATALAAVFFVVLLGVGMLQVGGGSVALAPGADSAAEPPAMTAEVGIMALEESATAADEEATMDTFAGQAVAEEEALPEAAAADEARVEEEAADDGGAAEPPAEEVAEGETSAAEPAATRGVQGGVTATEAPAGTPAATATLVAPRPEPEETEPPRVADEALDEATPPPPPTPMPEALEAPALDAATLLFGALLAVAGAGLAALLVATLVIRRRLP